MDIYYTKRGKEMLEARLNSLTHLYLKVKTFPTKVRFYGLPDLEISSREHLQGMIDGMCHLLGKDETIIEVKNNGE